MTLKKIDIGEITKAVKNCTTPKQKTIIEIMTEVNLMIEKWIRKRPDQWWQQCS